MSDVTRILSDIEQGDARASEQLLPLVYEERGIDPCAYQIFRPSCMARTYVVGDRAVESRDFDGARGRDEHRRDHGWFFRTTRAWAAPAGSKVR